MRPQNRCKHCHRKFIPNPRVKDQLYCSRVTCQQARKNRWQRRKMATDSDYRRNQSECQPKWRQNNPDYWDRYRKTHPKYCEQNRQLQKRRDVRRKAKRLAKMDVLKQLNHIKQGSYYVIPIVADLAKMDALMQKIFIIPSSCTQKAASCKEGLDGQPSMGWIQCLEKEETDDASSTLSGSSP
jgi:hypothetical protein